jgi:hypothetical protein
MFPEVLVADDAISTVRDAIKSIHHLAGKPHPEWVELCEIKGWDIPSQTGAACLAQAHFGAKFEDPKTKRVFIVIDGEEQLTSVFPLGHDTSETVARLLRSVKVPIEAIRVYEAGELIEDNRVKMRGNLPSG